MMQITIDYDEICISTMRNYGGHSYDEVCEAIVTTMAQQIAAAVKVDGFEIEPCTRYMLAMVNNNLETMVMDAVINTRVEKL